MKKLTIFYDNFCPNCTRFATFIQKLDWLKLIEMKQVRNELDTKPFEHINLQLATQQMASLGSKWHYGYNSLYYISARLPLFWLFIPLFYLLKITRLGQLIYIELALKRKIIPIHCDTEICEKPPVSNHHL